MSNTKTWKLIANALEQKVPVMLLYVLESKGSSPGRQGFCMAVDAAGKMEGSVGGGIMEHKFVEMAKSNLHQAAEQQSPDVRKQVHDKSAAKNQSGMICSGEQTILLYEVKQADLPTVRAIISSMEQNKNGTLALSPAGINFENAIPQQNYEYNFENEERWSFIEKTGYKNELSVIGGGHCALAFSRLMRTMDFYIRVYDERNDLKTMVENDAAHEKYVIGNYSELKNLIHSGNDHYVVIMTFGYRTDDTALRALVGKQFKYLGLLGSKNKIAKMFDHYESEDIAEDWLQKIHTPIGLSIKSQTPEEIAISIAAQIISVKNQEL